MLWKGIVQSKLLAKCIIVRTSPASHLVLPPIAVSCSGGRAAVFLNKFDLLEKKLAGGTKVNRYLPSFADRENNGLTLARCRHFRPRARLGP